jgi:uncharacterized protein (TIGR01244 family)
VFKTKLFFISLLLTTGVCLTGFYIDRPARARFHIPHLQAIVDGVYLTSQVRPEDMLGLNDSNIDTIVDIRPDGEEPNQPSSAQIAAAASKLSIKFHYIPVPHENIPDNAVTALNGVLANKPGPTVLYCRTGRRAIRLFALVQASLPNGPDTNAILAMARNAGFSAEDIKEEIARRIAHRNETQTGEKQ